MTLILIDTQHTNTWIQTYIQIKHTELFNMSQAGVPNKGLRYAATKSDS